MITNHVWSIAGTSVWNAAAFEIRWTTGASEWCPHLRTLLTLHMLTDESHSTTVDLSTDLSTESKAPHSSSDTVLSATATPSSFSSVTTPSHTSQVGTEASSGSFAQAAATSAASWPSPTERLPPAIAVAIAVGVGLTVALLVVCMAIFLRHRRRHAKHLNNPNSHVDQVSRNTSLPKEPTPPLLDSNLIVELDHHDFGVRHELPAPVPQAAFAAIGTATPSKQGEDGGQALQLDRSIPTIRQVPVELPGDTPPSSIHMR
jgi:hypothetical protein